MQLAELRKYVQAHGWAISDVYVDLGVSGSRELRPEFNRMMADAHQRSFDAVLCWKLDRMGRSLKHLVNTLADLQAYGVAFVSLRDNLDLSIPSGRLMFHVVGAMAGPYYTVDWMGEHALDDAKKLLRAYWRFRCFVCDFAREVLPGIELDSLLELA